MEIDGGTLYIFNTLNASHIEILTRLANEESPSEIKVGHEALYLRRFGLIQGGLSDEILTDVTITETGRDALVFFEKRRRPAR